MLSVYFLLICMTLLVGTGLSLLIAMFRRQDHALLIILLMVVGLITLDVGKMIVDRLDQMGDMPPMMILED